MDAALEVRSLVKHFGRVRAVDGVSLRVGQGEVVGYLGPNGAGKTTTIRCMMGLLGPSSGSIRLLGSPLPSALPQILDRVGHIPGEFGLWPQLTGADCLTFLGRLHRRPAGRRAALCERFELSRAELARPVRSYSRGMRQKVAIVQAWQHDPELVVMDEPTEGLDPVMKERFLTLLDEHRATGGAALMSSHILSEVERAADRLVALRAGTVVRELKGGDLAGRVHHCSVTLEREAADLIAEQLPGAVNLSRVGSVVRFDHRGSMAPLITALAQLPVVEFTSEPASLQDMFFEIYGQDAR